MLYCNRPKISKSISVSTSLFLLGLAMSACVPVSNDRGHSEPPVSRTNPQPKKAVPPKPVSESPQQKYDVEPAYTTSESVEYGKCAFISNDLQGRPTASGDRYDKNEFTASHPSLPFGTMCLVTNLSNNRSVRVRINDRFPRSQGRIIDISYSAAQALEMVLAGVVNVKLEVIEYPEGIATKPRR